MKLCHFISIAMLAASPAVHSQTPAVLTPARAQELLFDAATMGRTDLVPVLIAAGADVNAYDPRGFTPLILAAYNDHIDTVNALLVRKADPCKPDSTQGNTAQMGVAFKGYDPIAKALLRFGCEVDAQNKQGQTALMMAAMFGRQAQVDMLVAAGAKPQAKDAAGRTAASVARSQGSDELAARLDR